VNRRWLRLVVVALAAAVVAGAFSRSSYGITWCFDWVAYQVNGHHDTNKNSAQSLRELLEKEGYRAILEVSATSPSASPSRGDVQIVIKRLPAPAPQVDEKLKPGDVLIFGTYHTGIVRSSTGRFDHFLQVPGVTKEYTPEELPTLSNYFVGPNKSWTLEEFFAFSRETAPVNTESWSQWLGRRLFGAPRQYPFLGTTATVYRVVSAPATVAAPTTSTLTATLNGSSASDELGWGPRNSNLHHQSGMNQYGMPRFEVHPGDSITFQEQFDQPLPQGSSVEIAVGQGSLGAGRGTPGYTVIKTCRSPASSCKVTYTVPPHSGGGNEMSVNAYVTCATGSCGPYTNSFRLIYAGLG